MSDTAADAVVLTGAPAGRTPEAARLDVGIVKRRKEGRTNAWRLTAMGDETAATPSDITPNAPSTSVNHTTRGTTRMTASSIHPDACASRAFRSPSVVVSPSVAVGRLGIVWLLALLVMLMVSSSALGATSRSEIASFGSGGTSASVFGGASQLAFDQSARRLFVLDAGASQVDGFDVSTAGTYAPLGGGFPVAVTGLGGSPDVAVDNSGSPSAGNLYFLGEGSGLYGFTPAGVAQAGNFPVSGFADPCGAAVDPSGNVWVGDYGTQSVKEYSSAGAAMGSVGTGAQGSPCHVAFDANGDLYAAMYSGAVWKYAAAGGYATAVEIDADASNALTVDRASHHVYVVHGDRVNVYDATGVALYTFAKDIAGASLIGVAVDQSTDRVFVADAGNNSVHVFGSPVLIAGATTGAASDVTLHAATLRGSANAGGVALSDCHFEYGTDASYGQSAPCVPAVGSIPVDSAEHAVSAAISGLAPDQSYHARLVVTNANGTISGDDQTFTTLAGAVTDAATNIGLSTATLNGTARPGGVAVDDCHFDYGTDTTYGQSASCVPAASAIPADSSDHGVSADLTGLTSNQVYHFRLVVTGANGSRHGTDRTFATPGPGITNSVTAAVDVDSATLTARINPNALDTTYHFDYGTSTAYGQSTPESVSIGADNTDHPVSKTLTGLTAGTTYHWRIVVTNASGTVIGVDHAFTTPTVASPPAQSCANAQFRTGHAMSLPDCRAYEQATPIAKNGNNPIGGTNFSAAADDGDAVTFAVSGGIPGGVGSQDYPSFLAQRGTGAWSSAGVFPPATYGQLANVKGWTRDLKTVFSAAMSFEDVASTFLARDSTDGTYETIVPYAPQSTIYQPAYFSYVGASRDGSVVYFETAGALTADGAAGAVNLYAVARTSGVARLAGVLPDGTTPPGGSFAAPYDLAFDNVNNGGAQIDAYTQDTHVVSDDGSAVFFTAAGTAQLYLRKDATRPSASTVHISASQKTNGSGPGGGDPNGPRPAALMAATPDASTALFISREELTNDAHTGPGDERSDLYAYDAASGRLTDLTPDSDDVNGADVRGVIGISDDASYVYFVANGVLADGATPGDCEGWDENTFAGSCNLYLWHHGDTSFVARLDAKSDGTNWRGTIFPGEDGARQSTGRVTPDGRALLFSSRRRLTAYDNSIGCGIPNIPTDSSACIQLYRYRVGDPGVSCVSCNPSGAAPTGHVTVLSMVGPFIRPPAAVRPRNLSADGDRVFFESLEPLLAGDTNGVKDVYLWQADGSGSCETSAVSGGCLYLLSTGRSPYASYFADASVSGDDAFFFTDSQLVSGDRDGQVDLYDARVGGGMASQHPVEQVPCAGEACKAPPTAPAVSAIAGSVVFAGTGNVGAPARTSVSVSRLGGVTGAAARLRVKVPRAGRISVSGASLTTVRRSVSKAATYTIAVRLTAKARRTLKRNSSLRAKVRVGFVASSGGTASRSMTLIFKPTRAGKASSPGRSASKAGG